MSCMTKCLCRLQEAAADFLLQSNEKAAQLTRVRAAGGGETSESVSGLSVGSSSASSRMLFKSLRDAMRTGVSGHLVRGAGGRVKTEETASLMG